MEVSLVSRGATSKTEPILDRHVRDMRELRLRYRFGRRGQEITAETTADLLAEPETCLVMAMFGEEDDCLLLCADSLSGVSCPQVLSNDALVRHTFYF
jgi:hypothetical protein